MKFWNFALVFVAYMERSMSTLMFRPDTMNPSVFTNNNEWSPLGGKDPLKNLAISDYIPPLLQDVTVKYWTHSESSNKHKQRETTWKNSMKFNKNHQHHEISPQNGINSASHNFHHQKSNMRHHQHQTRQANANIQHDKFMYYSLKPSNNWQKHSPTQKPYQHERNNEKMKSHVKHEDSISLGSHLQIGKFDHHQINEIDIKPMKIHNTTSILMEKLVNPEDVNSLAAQTMPIEKSTVAVKIGKLSDPESYVNMVIQGHSRVKTFGNSAKDEIGKYLPEIHTVQGPENPVVAYVENFKAKDKKVSVKKLFEFLTSGESVEKK